MFPVSSKKKQAATRGKQRVKFAKRTAMKKEIKKRSEPPVYLLFIICFQQSKFFGKIDLKNNTILRPCLPALQMYVIFFIGEQLPPFLFDNHPPFHDKIMKLLYKTQALYLSMENPSAQAVHLRQRRRAFALHCANNAPLQTVHPDNPFYLNDKTGQNPNK